jgi:hypothetical protein
MSMIGNFLGLSDIELQTLRRQPEGMMTFLYGEDGEAVHPRRLSVDKAWHGLHFLLNGDPWSGSPPLDFIVGGEAIGEVDVGYGPARGFSSAQVAAIHEALAPITWDELRASRRILFRKVVGDPKS